MLVACVYRRAVRGKYGGEVQLALRFCIHHVTVLYSAPNRCVSLFSHARTEAAPVPLGRMRVHPRQGSCRLLVRYAFCQHCCGFIVSVVHEVVEDQPPRKRSAVRHGGATDRARGYTPP